MEDIIVINEKENSRFVLRVNGSEAYLRYVQNSSDMIEMINTFVPEHLRENGLGSNLAKEALNYARENNLKVVPRCSFVRHFIDQHSEYKELVK